jgi:hypothetical protein
MTEGFNHPLYCLEDLVEKRRNVLRYARSFPPGSERNQHWAPGIPVRPLFPEGGTCRKTPGVPRRGIAST